MIQNFYDAMTESTLNWLKYSYLNPDSLIHQNNKSFSKPTSHLNGVYILHPWSGANERKHTRESSPYVGLVEAQVTWWLGRRSRPPVHLFVCFKHSPRSLPPSHRLAASSVSARDSSHAKENLLRANTRLQVERQNLCRKELSEMVNFPENQSETHMQLTSSDPLQPRPAEVPSWSAGLLWKSQQQSYSHNSTYSLYSHSH